MESGVESGDNDVLHVLTSRANIIYLETITLPFIYFEYGNSFNRDR